MSDSSVRSARKLPADVGAAGIREVTATLVEGTHGSVAISNEVPTAGGDRAGVEIEQAFAVVACAHIEVIANNEGSTCIDVHRTGSVVVTHVKTAISRVLTHRHAAAA